MANINTDYLDDLVKRFKGFKSPNDTQQLIIILGEKDNRSEDDNRKLAVLMMCEVGEYVDGVGCRLGDGVFYVNK